MDFDEPKLTFPEESRSGRPVKLRETYDPTPNPTRPRKPRAINPNTTKWTTYRSTAQRLISSLIREDHYLEALTAKDTPYGMAEVVKIKDRIKNVQKSLRATLEQINNEDPNDHAWPELAAGDGDSVDIENVVCSRCLQDSEDGNDILFCDHVGCCKAFHQLCLVPPVHNKEDVGEDWFCPKCECSDHVLEKINEYRETTGRSEFATWDVVFATPDIDSPGVEGSDDDDDDYDPEANDASYDAKSDESSEASDNSDDQSENSSFRGNSRKRNSSGSSDEEESCYVDSDESDAEIDGIDEEEVNGLLVEANVADKTKLANNKERSLRKKRDIKALEIIANNNEDNKGRKVAKVFRGIVYPGEVVDFKTETIEPAEEGGQAESFNLWVCKYENDVLLDLEFEELIEQLHLYNDYKAEMDENEAKEEAAESAAEVKKVGAIAAENIIHTKRARVSVDYSKLNEEMFDDQFVE